jgi:hypothetical protein
MTLGNVAAASALAAIGALLVAGITIALFFGGAGDYWGPVNDVFSALALLLLVPVMLAVLRLAPDDIGPWFALITYAAIAGALLGAAGQVILVLGGISLQASFVTGGIGLMPILAWGIGLAVLVFSRDMLSVVVGWLLVGVLLSAVLLTVVSQFAPWPVIAAGGVITLALLIAWLATLSGELPTAI